MVDGRMSCAGIVLAVCAAVFSGSAFTEVYKWVDEEGNVHFGDKPLDKARAERAEKIDIVEAYQPTGRTPEEKSAYDEEEEALKRRHQTYREEDRLAREEEKQKRSAERTAMCASLKEEIAAYSGTLMVDGMRAYYYKTDEDGKSLTSEQQREYVLQLKKKYNAAGCR